MYIQFGSTTPKGEVARELGVTVGKITDCAMKFGYTDECFDEFQIADIKNRLRLESPAEYTEQFVTCNKRNKEKTVQANIVYEYLKSLAKPTHPVVIGKYFGIRSVSVLNALTAYTDVAEEDDGCLFIVDTKGAYYERAAV